MIPELRMIPEPLVDDPHFKVVLLQHTPYMNQVMYQAMHQDYYSKPVYTDELPSEEKCGSILVKRLLNGNRGHFGVLEHPQLTFNVCGYSHTVMQQLRTHRVGITFDVQSFRYTGQYICDPLVPLDEIFYLRPVGMYTDREGKHYEYTEHMRNLDLDDLSYLRDKYTHSVTVRGFSYEHARDLIPYAIRQHFVVSCNLRSLLHLVDLRAKVDAELETRDAVTRMWLAARPLFPKIAQWYERFRFGKALLAP